MRTQRTSFILILILLLPLYSIPLLAHAETTYNRHFSWNYNDREWTWDLSISSALYQQYKSVSAQTRNQYKTSEYGFFVTTSDSYIKSLSNSLENVAEEKGYSDYDKVSFALAFVQSLKYTSDSVTTGHDEYPRFPVETLVDEGGDCEDTAILFATIVKNMGYGVILVNPPGHVAVGVLGNELPGSYYTVDEKKYYYCETTGSGWRIGDVPSNYDGVKASMIKIDSSAQFVPQSTESSNQPSQGGSTAQTSFFDPTAIFLIIIVVIVIYLAGKMTSSKNSETVNAEKTTEKRSETTLDIQSNKDQLDNQPELEKTVIETEQEASRSDINLVKASESQKGKEMKYSYCIKCGSRLHSEADYCGVCGYKIPFSEVGKKQ